MRRGLEAHVVGHTISTVEVLHPRPVRRHLAGPDHFTAALTGRRVLAARRRGKYLWLPLGSGDALLVHLGMSGQLLVQPPDAPAERHLRVRFGLEGSDRELRFVDQRMFGGLWLSVGGSGVPGSGGGTAGPVDVPPEIAHIARDPMDPAFDADEFVRRVRRRTSAVKRILLDQTVVSGIGNIYADEALWRARVHGDRLGSRLTAGQVRGLLDGVREVMSAALAQGGTSFDSLYVNVNGESGYFDRSLEVYGREGRPCSRCGTPVTRVSFMNRSSFFCPRCQPRPRLPRAQAAPPSRTGRAGRRGRD